MFEITVWPIADADRGGCVVVFIYTPPPLFFVFFFLFFLTKEAKNLDQIVLKISR